MKDTKLGEFKIISRVTLSSIKIAYKQKGGLVFTATDWGHAAIEGCGFTFHLGKDFTQVTFHKDDKGRFYLEIVQPAKDEKIKLHPVGKDKYEKFLETDYNGKLFIK